MHNGTLYPQRTDYLLYSFTVCSTRTVATYLLQPPSISSSFGDADPRSHLLAVHAPDPNGNYAICNDSPATNITAETDLQLTDNTRENISLDWPEL